ncbi:haloacid dehalogenase-like hydrolase [Paenibacillus tarimensis]
MKQFDTSSYDFSYIDQWIDKGMKHALIDVDNTLVKANITELYFYLKKQALRSQWRWILWCIYFAILWAPLYLLLDFINREWFQRAFYRRYHEFSYDQIEEASEMLFQQKCSSSLIEVTHDLIGYLKERNVNVVLLSTNIDSMVRLYANFYGVSYMSLSLLQKGTQSIVLLNDLENFKLRSASCYPPASVMAVADSKHDLPVLNYAAYSIVVANRRKAWMSKISGNCTIVPGLQLDKQAIGK